MPGKSKGKPTNTPPEEKGGENEEKGKPVHLRFSYGQLINTTRLSCDASKSINQPGIVWTDDTPMVTCEDCLNTEYYKGLVNESRPA